MFKFAALLTSAGVLLAVAISGKPAPVAPAGAWFVDNHHSDAQLITDATTNWGKNKITYTLGITRVTGRVFLDNDNPDKSAFDITMYPAASMTPPINEQGKVKMQWLENYANQTLVCFHSKGVYPTTDGKIRTTGYLVLTRVDRNVEYNPGEDYAGPIYGPAQVHRIKHPATFVFDVPAASSGQKNDQGSGQLVSSGSTKVIREDFPQLLRAVIGTYWPPVIQDEKCNQPSTVGEDYSGPKCTGTFMETKGLPEEPSDAGVGEDFPAPSDYSSVVGNQLTIAVHLRLQPDMPQSKAASGN